ncbi:MAG: crotonase/enoyl-CoA hydratase family protein [Clostridiales bacterium]|nr:crotonase/enoyl-CoA hydratase family protein [Clostridiales bacterium]
MASLRIWREGPVYVVEIHRPHVRNAIDRETALELREAWKKFAQDPELKVGILTGGDEAFSAGADLNDIEALSQGLFEEEGPLGFTRLWIPKPTLAAIAGPCVAGGLEMALWCDLRIADETAYFGCLERRFGVPLIDGGTQRLPRIIGMGRALDLILTGRRVSVGEALSIGLITEVVPKGKHLERALHMAQELASFPQVCLQKDREALYRGWSLPMQEGLVLEAFLGGQVLASGEPQKGAQAFREGKGRGGKPL